MHPFLVWVVYMCVGVCCRGVYSVSVMCTAVIMWFCVHIWDFQCFSAITDVLVDYLTSFYNSVEAGGWRKFLDEIHGDGIPGSFQDWELLQESVRSVMLQLESHTGAGLAIVLKKGAEEQPSVVITDKLKGLVLAKVSGDWMVMFVEQNA